MQRILLAVGLFAILLMVIWGRNVFSVLQQRRQFEESQNEDAPSIDERLNSELSTLEVVLLRGSIEAYYEKIFSLVKQLLKGRHLIERLDLESEQILIRLRREEVDPAYLDTVDSLLQRCDAVRIRGEKMGDSAHAKIAKDLRTLIRMRPHRLPTRKK